GLSGMAGLWGIGFFSPELIRTAMPGQPKQVVDTAIAFGTTLQDVGAFFGMLTFTFVATKVNVNIPKNAPTSWSVVPNAMAVSTTCLGCPGIAVRMSSGEKNPMPHNPAMPDNP